MNKLNLYFLSLAAIILPTLTSANCCCINTLQKQPSHWSIEVGTGIPFNFPTSLQITQELAPSINMHARYKSRPFYMPFYHDLRLSKWQDGMAWEFEDIHHKIYLKNTNPIVEHFSISHGYNLFYVNRAIEWHSLIWRLGAGIVIGHPESTIRRHTFAEKGGTFNNGGYYLAGASAQGSIGKRFYLYRKWFLEVEAKITASEARVPIVNGYADAPNVAFHANFGLGYDL